MATKQISKTAKVTKATSQEKPQKLNQAWAELFAANEKASKAERKTDEQLVKEMQRRFPDRKEKSTIVRPNMIRSIYNKGSNMFRKFGPAKTKSRRYGKDGEVLEGRTMPPHSARKMLPAQVKTKIILKKKKTAEVA